MVTEFVAPSDDVPVPPPSDPATDPPGTVRVEDWVRRFDPSAARWIRVAGGDPWPWVQITGVSFDPDRDGDAAQDSPWRTDGEVAVFPVAQLFCLATTFRHAARERAVELAARSAPVLCDDQAPRLVLPAVLDGADAEGGAPFKDRG